MNDSLGFNRHDRNSAKGNAVTSTVRHLLSREQEGPRGSFTSWAQTYGRKILRTLQFSTTKGVQPANPQVPAGDLVLDHIEDKFLLTTWGDASVSIYDTQAKEASSEEEGPWLEPVCHAGRAAPGAHRFSVSAACWWATDTGMFITGSHDKQVKVWDTNALQVVQSFSSKERVTRVAVSHVPSAHALIAIAAHEQDLRLGDLASGAFTHTMVGHRHPIWTVAWSVRSEHELVSGDEGGQVLVWDIRRFGAVQVLDMYRTQRPPCPSFADEAARDRHVPAGDRGLDTSSHVPPRNDVWGAPALGRQVSGVPPPAAGEEGAGSSKRRFSAPGGLEGAVESAWGTLEELGYGGGPTGSSKRPRASVDFGAGSRNRVRGGATGNRDGVGDRLQQPPALHSIHRQPSPQRSAGNMQLGGQPLPSQPGSRPLPSGARPAVSLPAPTAAGAGSSLLGLAPVRGAGLAPPPASVRGGRGGAGSVIGGHAPSHRARSGGQWEDRGALSDQAVRAHQGAVTCLLPTPDGLSWVSCGNDGRLRLWDAMLFHNRLAGYDLGDNRLPQFTRPCRMSVTPDSTSLMVPGTNVQVVDTWGGRSHVLTDRRTSTQATCAQWNPLLQQLYTAGDDGRVAVWSLPTDSS